MILVAVGTQFPFDRLIKAVDRWAGQAGASEVIAQIGDSSYVPCHIKARAFVPPAEFQALLERADLVIAHCGMGSILSALSCGKDIVVMPRSAANGEHRNDHQFATARSLAGQPGLTIVWDEHELKTALGRLSDGSIRPPFAPISKKASKTLTDNLRAFLIGGG